MLKSIAVLFNIENFNSQARLPTSKKILFF